MAALPGTGSPLLDRLFALECAVRGGAATAGAAAILRRSLSEVDHAAGLGWEPDVPHAAIIGQAVAVAAADGRDVPDQWHVRLDAAVDRLTRRETRLGIASDVRLLSSVVRGLAASGRSVPGPLAAVCDELLESNLTLPEIAELTEALSRHPALRRSAADAARRAFANDLARSPGGQARWWLAERWQQLHHQQPPVATELIDAARRFTMATPAPTDPRVAAMTAEVLGRTADGMVIAPAAEVAERYDRTSRRVVLELYAWRVLAIWVICGLLAMNAAKVLGFVSQTLGTTPPVPEVHRAWIGALAAIAWGAVTLAVRAWYRRTERPLPGWAEIVGAPMVAVAGVAAYLLYPG